MTAISAIALQRRCHDALPGLSSLRAKQRREDSGARSARHSRRREWSYKPRGSMLSVSPANCYIGAELSIECNLRVAVDRGHGHWLSLIHRPPSLVLNRQCDTEHAVSAVNASSESVGMTLCGLTAPIFECCLDEFRGGDKSLCVRG